MWESSNAKNQTESVTFSTFTRLGGLKLSEALPCDGLALILAALLPLLHPFIRFEGHKKKILDHDLHLSLLLLMPSLSSV